MLQTCVFSAASLVTACACTRLQGGGATDALFERYLDALGGKDANT